MKSFIFFSISLLNLIEVNTLQCYQCWNCSSISDEHLVTCGMPATTSTSILTSPISTNAPGSTTTTDPKSTTTDDSSSSTTVDPNPTDDPSSVATDDPSSVATDDPSSVATDDPSSVATDDPSSPSNDIDFFDNDCICENSKCDCNDRFKIRVEETADENYVCVTDFIEVNNMTIINRGCAVEYNTTEQTCVQAFFSADCKVCNTDRCNMASPLQFPTAVFIFAIVMSTVNVY